MSSEGGASLLAPGSVFARRFRIEEELGRGGMGVVYRAFHLHLRQDVALKVLHREAARDRESKARFVREAQVALTLTSPNIVRVHDLGLSDHDEPFIQMELLRGRSLETVIGETSALSAAQAVDLVVQAAAGVATAHAAGLVHRDLKPENLFLANQSDGTEVVKVLDFGITKMTPSLGDEELTTAGTAFGSPHYMAPEQCVNATAVDALCDQYALGVVLYELLTKCHLFEGENTAALTYKILAQKAPSVRVLRPDIPIALDEAIQKALAKNPSDRFTDVTGFARAIVRFGGGAANEAAETIEEVLQRPPRSGGIGTTAEATFERAAPRTESRTRPLFWAALVAVPLAAVGVTSAWLSRGRDALPPDADTAVHADAMLPSTPIPTHLETDAQLTATARTSDVTPATTSVAPSSEPTRPLASNAPNAPKIAKPTPSAPHGPAHQPIFQIPND
jgi:serine/threonine protein kinase